MDFDTEGGRVRALRMHLKLTQAQFARELELKQPHISEVEKDVARLSLDALKKMYLCFGYSPIFHIMGEGDIIIARKDKREAAEMLHKREKYESAQHQKEMRKLLEQVEILKTTINELNTKNEQLTEKYIRLNEKHIKLSEKYLRFSEKYGNLVEREKTFSFPGMSGPIKS